MRMEDGTFTHFWREEMNGSALQKINTELLRDPTIFHECKPKERKITFAKTFAHTYS